MRRPQFTHTIVSVSRCSSVEYSSGAVRVAELSMLTPLCDVEVVLCGECIQVATSTGASSRDYVRVLIATISSITLLSRLMANKSRTGYIR